MIFSNILLNKKSYKTHGNIFNYDISYKTYDMTFHSSKPLRIRFDEIDGFIKIFDDIRYLVLLSYEIYGTIYNRITYRLSEKSGITDSNNRNFARFKIDSYSSLLIEKALTLML